MSPAIRVPARVRHIQCSGTPYDIGLQHGQDAKTEVLGSIDFYRDFFLKKCKLDWPAVQGVAQKFEPNLKTLCPDLVDEMRGVADGAGVDFESILALNVRTEIAYGMMSDGCTAFAWKTADITYLAQNWDWNAAQRENIICTHITQSGKPTIHMMTEGGIIGKIGLNSAGVGVTLNAISAKGVAFDKLPVHLALRTALNSTSRDQAAEALRSAGVASACHIQVADKEAGAIGFECSSTDIKELEMNDRGITTHSNHFVENHGVDEPSMWQDSPPRLARIGELLKGVRKTSMQSLAELLKDEQGFPASICRAEKGSSTSETLFSIVMNLTEGFANVKMGRPTEDGEEFQLRP